MSNTALVYYWYTLYLVWLDVLDERGLSAVVQPDHEDAHISTEATHSRRDLLEQPHGKLGLVNSSSMPLELTESWEWECPVDILGPEKGELGRECTGKAVTGSKTTVLFSVVRVLSYRRNMMSIIEGKIHLVPVVLCKVYRNASSLRYCIARYQVYYRDSTLYYTNMSQLMVHFRCRSTAGRFSCNAMLETPTGVRPLTALWVTSRTA